MEKSLHWLVPVAADTTKYVTLMSNEPQGCYAFNCFDSFVVNKIIFNIMFDLRE